MSEIFIVFSEHGRLHSHCEELVKETYPELLKKIRMCFFDGNRQYFPVRRQGDMSNVPGILLVHDAHDDAAYDTKKTINLLKKITKRYNKVYVCYHTGSVAKWLKVVDKLPVIWGNRHLVKSHNEMPYQMLLEFHRGTKNIADMIDFWWQEEQAYLNYKRDKLKQAVGEAIFNADCTYLDSSKGGELLSESRLNKEQLSAFENLLYLLRKNGTANELQKSEIIFLNSLLYS